MTNDSYSPYLLVPLLLVAVMLRYEEPFGKPVRAFILLCLCAVLNVGQLVAHAPSV